MSHSPSATGERVSVPKELLAKLADVHRGWCNYCKGDPLACLNAPAGGCSLRDYMMALGAPRSETRLNINTIQRYELENVGYHDDHYMMSEDPDGEYVKYEDAAKLVTPSAIRPSTESVASARYVLGDQPAHSLHERTLALEILRLAGEGR